MDASWNAFWGQLGPCPGCGSACYDTCIFIKDNRCAAREKTRAAAADLKSAVHEVSQLNNALSALLKEEERLRQTFAREDAYIASIHAALEEAYSRRAAAKEAHAARWSDARKLRTDREAAIQNAAESTSRLRESLLGMQHALAGHPVLNEGSEQWGGSEEDKENERPTTVRRPVLAEAYNVLTHPRQMQPIWKSEYTGGFGPWDPTPCRCCGRVGKHIILGHRGCAEMELESATGARVLTDRAWGRLRRIIKDAEENIEKSDEECRVADNVVNELLSAIAKSEHRAISPTILGPLRRALRAAETTRDNVVETRTERTRVMASLYRQRMAMCDLLNVAEVRVGLATKACDDINPTSRDISRDARLRQPGSTSQRVEERARWWEQAEFADPDVLGEEQEERYQYFLDDWTMRRRGWEYSMRRTHDDGDDDDEAARWAAATQTSTPTDSLTPVHSIKVEEVDSDNAPTPASSPPETMSSPRRLLWGHTNDWATRGTVKREEGILPASDDSIEEALGRAFRNIKRPGGAGATTATGRARRTAPRQKRRTKPY
ncbi:hypothetical protein CORC01_02214 [Colletotrichum orchidophilum]|uniref:Uncharacterized protein n=1 Tax=Colletotrichum orchidophilum TaxID=1209926 RepID=A0A1G4BM32_9PEZI|nr:uncharacterized protein CORC01_02214 [Colletotrichum orchidophilum]OHF02519.1 hypothetical protein CORC01_02214 [Colletotrichum orchidophilum]